MHLTMYKLKGSDLGGNGSQQTSCRRNLGLSQNKRKKTFRRIFIFYLHTLLASIDAKHVVKLFYRRFSFNSYWATVFDPWSRSWWGSRQLCNPLERSVVVQGLSCFKLEWTISSRGR